MKLFTIFLMGGGSTALYKLLQLPDNEGELPVTDPNINEQTIEKIQSQEQPESKASFETTDIH